MTMDGRQTSFAGFTTRVPLETILWDITVVHKGRELSVPEFEKLTPPEFIDCEFRDASTGGHLPFYKTQDGKALMYQGGIIAADLRLNKSTVEMLSVIHLLEYDVDIFDLEIPGMHRDAL